jgi:ankyrin repeat protein
MQRRKSTVKGQVDFSTDRDDVDEAYELIDTWMHFAAVGNLSAINAQLESNKYGQIKSTVSTLLKSKASSAKWDVNVQDRVCNTALLYAVWNGQVDAVKLLISHGADVKHQNESRTTAAHVRD